MRHFLMIAAILFFISCNKENNPRIVHSEDDKQENSNLIKDSTLIEIANLPIEIDSTDFLIHPIGYFKIEDSRGKIIYKSSNYRSQSFSISNYRNYTLSGDLTNVLFQHKNSNSITPLTNNFIKIMSMTFLKKVSDKIKKQYLIYKIIDKDSNQDGKLDFEDVSSLYISRIDGTELTKLSKENNELIDWKIILSNNRLYFRTVEDENKDGAFTNNDIVHYKYIDLNTDELKVIEYNPI